MLAKEVIEKCVVPEFQEKATVRAHIIEKDSWWHIHTDEEIPKDKPVSVYIRYQGFEW